METKTENLTEFKKRALLAKQRMRNGYWQGVQRDRAKRLAELGVDSCEAAELVRESVRAQIKREGNVAMGSNIDLEEESFYQKVCDLLESNEVITNPIGKLIDHELYDTLDEPNRQKYILELSKKFCTMKARYHAEAILKSVYTIQ